MCGIQWAINTPYSESWVVQVDSLRNELIWGQCLGLNKPNSPTLNKTEFKEFEMALQYKYNLHIYSGMNQEARFEKYLEINKWAPCRFSLTVWFEYSIGYLKSRVGMIRKVGYMNILKLVLVRNHTVKHPLLSVQIKMSKIVPVN